MRRLPARNLATSAGAPTLIALLVALVIGARDASATKRPRDVVASGATVASGSGKRLAGTLGQAVIGPTTGSAKRLAQGFWAANAAPLVDVAPPFGAPRVEFGAPTPNPSSGRVAFRLALPSEARVELQVLDVQGREVLSVDAGSLSAGTHVLTLDTEALPLARAGAWFARLLVDGRGSGARRFVRVR